MSLSLFRAAESRFPECSALPVHLVQNLLKALRMNSEEARLKFPRLLQIIESYPAETMDLMTKEVLGQAGGFLHGGPALCRPHLHHPPLLLTQMTSVPCWMLIGWIGQMLALLDKPEAVAVQHCIGQIAEFYPQALVYGLMISSEDYQFQDSATGHKQREFVNRYRVCFHARRLTV